MPEPQPTFHVTHHGRSLASVGFGESVVQGEALAEVDEQQFYGFEVADREPQTEYRVWVGDVEPEQPVAASRGRFAFWDDGPHFEGARGLVWVRLASRPQFTDEAWRDRLVVPVSVTSTKLSDAHYRAMFEQLRALSAGLVFDLVSKTHRSLGLAAGPGAVSVRSSQQELALLEQLWKNLAPALLEIMHEPTRQLTRARERRSCYGGERLGGTAIARLTGSGIDPRRPETARPFPALVERIRETDDTPEHRMIAGFLCFLRQRVEDCGEDVRRHLEAIERDRPLREKAHAGALSLYETEDRPRVRQLNDAGGRAARLSRQIGEALRVPPLRGVPPRFGFATTPVFRHVRPYRRVSYEMQRYLNSSLVLLDEGTGERLKSTSRLYEQWVFLQVAAAFRALGLACESHQGLMHQARRYRYTLDLERGAALRFTAADGTGVVVRYEPWIRPRAAARTEGDSLYRGRPGSAAWSPDVLIEVSERGESGLDAEVVYAAVLDAKYSGRIQEHHWDRTGKYLEIRSTHSDRQVARQLWLVHPAGGADGIALRDDAVRWTASGPSCPRDEFIHGTIALAPLVRDETDSAEPEEIHASGFLRPHQTALDFAAGLLAYLGIPLAAEVPLRVAAG